MTIRDRDRQLADSFDEFERRYQAGECPRPEEYEASLGDSYRDFLKVLQGKEALDRLLEPVADLPLPRDFGPYRLLEELGRGATGVVYRAEHRDTGRFVALKMLHGGLDRGTRERFRRESDSCRGVRHRNLVEMFDAGEVEGRPYYTMTLVEGPTLKGLIAADRRPGAEPLCEGLAGVAEALQALHDAGMLHRDVKPANIVVAPDGRYVLTDFGLARRSDFVTLTLSGQSLGTPHYMSPEQLRGHRGDIDHRTDIYGLGATLYEALTGKPVFDSREIDTLSGMILTDRPVPPRRLAPDLPAGCESVALKALEKQRRDRYQTASEMARDLSAVATGRTAKGRPVSRIRRGVRAVRAHWPVAAVVAAAVSIALFTWMNRPALVAITTVPRATVRVNGEPARIPEGGLELDPGPVRLRFEREGFHSRTLDLRLAAGEVYVDQLRLEVVDPDDPASIAVLADEFGLSPEAFRPGTHRGVPAAAAILPAGLVRAGHLERFRFELNRTDSFVWGGRLFFERDGEILHEEAFEPETLVTEAAIPASVLAALRPGDRITWGYRVEGEEEYVARFEMAARDEELDRELARIAEALEGQPASVGAYLRALALMRAGLMSEAVEIARAAADGESILPHGVAEAALQEIGKEKSRLGMELREAMRRFDAGTRADWLPKR